MKKILSVILLVAIGWVNVLQAQIEPGWKYAVVPPTLTNNIVPPPGYSSASPVSLAGLPGSIECPTLVTSGSGNSVIAEEITPEISALASRLENNPVRIYDYVHNYIKYVHYFGSKKGALLALLEGSGNDFDQCALLVSLLRAAAQNLGTPNVYTVKYQFGLMEMPYESADHIDIRSWLGLSLGGGPSAREEFIGLVSVLNMVRGYPAFINSGSDPRHAFYRQLGPNTFDLDKLIFHRVWVKLSYAGGSTYCLDPAFKVSVYQPGIDLGAAMQANLADLATAAKVGAVVGTDYTRNLNWNNLAAKLTTYSTQLLQDFRSSAHKNLSLDQVISGYTVTPAESVSLPGLYFPPIEAPFTAYAYKEVTVNGDPVNALQNGVQEDIPILEWDNIPAAYMSEIKLSVDNVNWSSKIPALKGRKLSLTFQGSSNAKISLDDVQAVLGSAGSGATTPMVTQIIHPTGNWNYVTKSVDHVARFDESDAGYNTLYQRAAKGYAIVYGFDDVSALYRRRQEKLDKMIGQGLPQTSAEVTTEALNVIGLAWLQQSYLCNQLVCLPKNVLPLYHHRVGRVAQETSGVPATHYYYVDLPFVYSAGLWTARAPWVNPGATYEPVYPQSFIASALEHGVIEQLQNNNSASVVKSLYLANQAGQKLILAPPTLAGATALTGYLTSEPLATRYNANDIQWLQDHLANGYSVFVPSGKSTVGQWTGFGLAASYTSGNAFAFSMPMSGGYKGGWGGTRVAVDSFLLNSSGFIFEPTRFSFTPPAVSTPFGADPVNLQDGSFNLDVTDLAVGQPAPRGFSFERHYDSNRRYTNEANIAKGWTHNYIMSVAERSDAAAGLGKSGPREAVSMLVTTHMVSAVFNSTAISEPVLRWSLAALIAKWGVDQLRNNAVSVGLGKDSMQFIKQADGTYTAPGGVKMNLTKPSGYRLEERHGNTFNFNSTSKKISTIVDQYGKALTFNYTANRLSSVVDCWGTSARTLTFSYNAAATPQLTSISDGTGRSVIFAYSTQFSPQGDLVSVTDVEGKIWRYDYDNEHKITATKDPTLPAARVIVQNVYDADGKVTQQLSEGLSTKRSEFFCAGNVSVEKDPSGGRTVYHYDSRQRLVKIQNPNGHVSQIAYDGQNHIVKQTSPLLFITESEYDGNDNMIKVVDPLMFTATFLYNPLDHTLVSKTDFRGKTTSYTYNNKFQVQTETGPNVNNDVSKPNVITYTYSLTDTATRPAGALVSQTDQDLKVTSFEYDNWGKVKKVTYHNSDFQTFVNNSRGDVTSATDPNNVVTTFAQNKRRQLTLTTTIQASGNVTALNEYDDAGNLWKITDPRGNVTTLTYSASGKLLKKTLPALATGAVEIQNDYDIRDWLHSTINLQAQTGLTYEYDAGHRLTSIKDVLDRTTILEYDADSRTVGQTTPLSTQLQKTSFAYNARGEQTSLTDAAGKEIQYIVDANGNPISTRNRRLKTFLSTYYDDGKLWTSQTPSGKTTTLSYNKRGLLETTVEPSGQTTTTTYDDRGRVSAVSDPVGTSNLTYDKNNNVLTHLENAKTISRQYDGLNRVTSYTDEAGNVIGYQYDKSGNLTKLTYPGGVKFVNYEYDSHNRLTKVTDWANRVTSIGYDAAGRLTSISRPNLTIRNVAYDLAGQTKLISESGPGGAINVFRFNYDGAGRVSSELVAPFPTVYVEAAKIITYDDDNRIDILNGQTVIHDSDGNMTAGPTTSGSSGGLYVYDSRNRLTGYSVTQPPQSWTYSYDSEGNRTAITTSQLTRFVINPHAKLSQVLVRINPDTTKTYYVYGAGLLYEVDEAENTKTYHYDSRGSTVALTSSGGSVIDRIEYDTYGKITFRSNFIPTPFLFNGRYGVMTDDNGLYYLRNRYYNPYIKRFINADPSGFAGGMNWYAYADGDPISMMDPFGLRAISDRFGGSWLDGTWLGDWGRGFNKGLERWVNGEDQNRYVATGSRAYQDGVVSGYNAVPSLLEVATFVALPGVGGSTARSVASSGSRAGLNSAAERGLAGSIRNVNPTGGGVNCVNCAIAAEYTLRGAPASALPTSGPLPISLITKEFGGSFAPVSGSMQIGSLLSRSGEGASGVVFGRGAGMNHVWNVVNQGGNIRFLDAQAGGLGVRNFEHFSDFQFLLTTPGR